ncbi:ComEA family DNA-binding protein [Salisediminibacterium selenitireducens]|uniref:Competence protein ComEA helix-hairpin-helix repeat protein n=1 Tax=Bacillus selenitireducens (strain ATCC 700615 / DSM 15326 / MLS10) TaxID=439292 RepID=D6XWC5_BACIE|nr:ComEA family DNA-binding protein [Salisediminibacterium selenitireducens]ADH99879.1 competence protein ComEA helix-hairpin-helix repeat protein [[Bacillus] selenitireducens MLS10]
MKHVLANWKLILISAGAGFLLMLALTWFSGFSMTGATEIKEWEDWSDGDVSEFSDGAFDDLDVEEPAVQHDSGIYIDVKGAVRRPGVYRMQSDDRVLDAVMEAGGFTDTAAHDGINLASRLSDEMVVYVPYEMAGEAVGVSPENMMETAWATMEEDDGLVCLNGSDHAALETLPGIGPAKAAAIIQYRDEHGPFTNEEELVQVPGIGDKTFETLRSLIKVSGAGMP